MGALEIVALVNTLLQATTAAGLAWQQVSAAVSKAQAEGREFGMQDVELLAKEAEASLAKLRAAIAAQPSG